MNRLANNEQITSSNKAGVLQELGGKLKCSCGYAIKSYSKSTNGRPYLDCYGNRSLHKCNHKFTKFNFYEIQETVAVEIQKQLDGINDILKQKDEIRKNKLLEIENLNKRLSALFEMSSTSELLAKATIKEIEKIQYQINELELDLKMNNDIGDPLAIEHFLPDERMAKKTPKLFYPALTTEEKKYVVNQFIDKIILNEETSAIEIVWKI